MNPEDVVAAARDAPPKIRLEDYREAVEALREKGYSWREVADFLTERGVVTDHTRVYRLFGGQRKERRKEVRPIEISSMTFLEERPTKRGRTWNVVEIGLPSKTGASITLEGYVWGTDTAPLELGEDNAVSYREPRLVTRSGRKGFPVAYLQCELQTEGGTWTPQEIYIVPKWDELL